MKTAIITGASSGLGREFVRLLGSVFPEIERVWLIARRSNRLKVLTEELNASQDLTPEADCLVMDLCDPMSLLALREKLAEEQPEVTLLINCAGCGYLGIS